ncbi:hypothetical protein [Pseudarthrobacter sp. N5]|uniref:hypothetical protein n=1 Tax=Pseudarthrobacter sp. N5 TaxID=3418416 RepID=UPI003CEC9CEB
MTSTDPPAGVASELDDALPEADWPTHEVANSQDDPFLFELIEYLAAIRDIEREVTAAIINAIPEDAKPHGLDCRVKDWESLHRKAKAIVLKYPYDFERIDNDRDLVRTVLTRIEDILRYSVLSAPHAAMPQVASAFIRKARDLKMRVTEIQNSYHSANRYKGLHAILSLAEKFQMRLSCEVQFHSSESIAASKETHTDYEKFRTSKDTRIRQSLHDRIAARYAELDDVVIHGQGFPIEVTKRSYPRPK